MTRYLSVEELPSPPRVLAGVGGMLTLFVLLRAFLGWGAMPRLMPLATATVSAMCLWSIGGHRQATGTFMRSGFHLGTLAFFVVLPILTPESVGVGLPEDVAVVVGWSLILLVAGFEASYWLSRLSERRGSSRSTLFVIDRKRQRLLLSLVVLGAIGWFLTILDSAVAYRMSVLDRLLAMRGALEQPLEGQSEFLSGQLSILQAILGGGLFLSSTAGSVLLITDRNRPKAVKLISWAAILLCTLAGFASSSRAVLFYSFCPLISTGWLAFTFKGKRSVRWMWSAVAIVVMVAIWGAMSAIRGDDIRRYRGGIEAFNPAIQLRSSLDIYSQMGVVVQSFPEVFPYQRGQSVLALVLGWVPRALWPDKPYPFSSLISFIYGESIERRSASIAVGLPGEGYGNYGLLGVFLWAAAMGVAARRMDDYVGGFHPNHPLRLQIAAMTGVWSAMIVRGGVPEMFYMGLGTIILPLGLARYLFRGERPAITYVTGPVSGPIGGMSPSPGIPGSQTSSRFPDTSSRHDG